jgi:hypothetical protein
MREPDWHDGLERDASRPLCVGRDWGDRALISIAVSLKRIADALATEARRAETENTGSVHEGAGPKDNAQSDAATGEKQ